MAVEPGATVGDHHEHDGDLDGEDEPDGPVAEDLELVRQALRVCEGQRHERDDGERRREDERAQARLPPRRPLVGGGGRHRGGRDGHGPNATGARWSTG